MKINQYNNCDESIYAEVFITAMYKFLNGHKEKMIHYIDTDFNTSLTKIFDNLVMVYIKNNN
jgi:hypothetical protein